MQNSPVIQHGHHAHGQIHKESEKPIAKIFSVMFNSRSGFSKRSVFFFLQKWRSMMHAERRLLIVVASAAAYTPISKVKESSPSKENDAKSHPGSFVQKQSLCFHFDPLFAFSIPEVQSSHQAAKCTNPHQCRTNPLLRKSK